MFPRVAPIERLNMSVERVAQVKRIASETKVVVVRVSSIASVVSIAPVARIMSIAPVK